MATADEIALRLDAASDFLERRGLDWVTVAVANVALLALVTRLYRLGERVAHWDEARVAYWTMRYIETGNFDYRPIIHGPFYHHVNRHVFGWLGANDFTMRLVVVVAGALFPLVALFFRERLRDSEVVALALFLAVNPVLLYYSRFMRGDPLVAMFMVTAFALFVRLADTGRRRYFLAGVAFVALGFTVKENAVLYLVTWAGATLLLVDHRLFRARDRGRNPVALAVGYARWAGGLLRRNALVLVAGVLEFLVVVVYFYAPRAATEEQTGLWEGVAAPAKLPGVLEAATVGAWTEFWGIWVSGSHQDHPYLPFLGDFLQSFAHGALALGLLAILGFLVDRYGRDGPRDVVSFAFYWGFVSVLGYPIVTDIKAPWATLHAVVPLAIPAAVGIGLFVGWGRRALADRDHVGAGVAALAILLVFGQVGASAAGAVYLNPQSDGNDLVQYAQPAGDISPVVDRLEVAAAANSGPDVILYGEFFVDDGNASVPRKPGCAKWFNALPLPWYFETTDADVTCASDEIALTETVSARQPPFVVTRESNVREISDDLENYETVTHRMRAWGTETTFFVHEEYADELGDASGTGAG